MKFTQSEISKYIVTSENQTDKIIRSEHESTKEQNKVKNIISRYPTRRFYLD